MRILIANRGEIARRIVRTAARLGHETVAVFADPDRDAPFVAEATAAVHIGPAALDASYLNVDRLIDAAQQSRRPGRCIPGYGFLSENAAFARAVGRRRTHVDRSPPGGHRAEWARRSKRAAWPWPAGVATMPGLRPPPRNPAELAAGRGGVSASRCW